MSETKFFNGVGELNRPTGISRDVVLRTLNLVWPDTGLTEIRIIAKHRWETKKVKDKEEPLTEILKGYFNEPLLIPDPLEKKLDELEKNGFNAQAYFLLNDINPDCQKVKTLSESELNQFSRGTATGDTDIVRRKWLLIDADPERAPHTSSTDEEKKNAYDVILQIKDKLQGFCFKDPVIASSGNGWHLLYRIDEPNDDETKNRISTILKGLKKEDALRMAAEAVRGAAEMVLQTGWDPEDLRLAVCSKGGTTLAGIEQLNANGFSGAVAAATEACYKRSEELSK